MGNYVLHWRCSSEEERDILLCIERASRLLTEDPSLVINESAYLSAIGEAATKLRGYSGPLRRDLEGALSKAF